MRCEPVIQCAVITENRSCSACGTPTAIWSGSDIEPLWCVESVAEIIVGSLESSVSFYLCDNCRSRLMYAMSRAELERLKS